MTAVGTSNNQIRVAVYNKIVPSGTLDSILASLGMTGFFDLGGVPENQAFPYGVLGESTELSFSTEWGDTFDTRGYNNTLSVHLWDQARGFQRLYSILARLNVLLHRQTLSLSSITHVGTWYMNALSVSDPDGITQHVMVRYRIFSNELV